MERRALSSSAGLFAVALTAMALLCPAAAQRVTVTPVAGLYFPLNQQEPATNEDCHGLGACLVTTTNWKIDEGRVLGLKVGVEYDRRHAIEVSVLRSAAVEWTTSETSYFGSAQVTETSSSVRNTYLTVQYRRTLLLSSQTDFTIGLGTSLIEFGGSANHREQVSFGLYPSVAFRTTVGPMRLDVSIADAIYPLQYTEPGGQSPFIQHDLILTAGLQIGGWK